MGRTKNMSDKVSYIILRRKILVALAGTINDLEYYSLMMLISGGSKVGTGGGMAAVKLARTMIVSENSNLDIVMAQGFRRAEIEN